MCPLLSQLNHLISTIFREWKIDVDFMYNMTNKTAVIYNAVVIFPMLFHKLFRLETKSNMSPAYVSSSNVFARPLSIYFPNEK